VAVDPILAGWNHQNLTPSPPIWDLLFSMTPALLLAIIGAWGLIRWRKQEKMAELGLPKSWSLFLVWVGLGLILMYLPWSLQRRFVIGFYIPLAGLSTIGMEIISQGRPRRYRFLVAAVFILAIPTNIIVLLAGFQATHTHDSQIYLTQPELKGLVWIEENTTPNDLVLSSPEMGLFIPPYTGRQVIYGHPFETVDAENEEKAVIDFFSGQMSETQMRDFVVDREVDYIFVGPREFALGLTKIPESWEPVYQISDVALYALNNP